MILFVPYLLVPAVSDGQDLTQEEIEKFQQIRDSLIQEGFFQAQADFITPQAASVEPVIEYATYTHNSLSVSTDGARGLDFRPDGKRFYVLGRNSLNVVEYQLSDAWNIESASYARELDISPEMGSGAQSGSVPNGLFFRKDDGKRMWVWNRTEIWEYTLSTAWDVTTATQTGYKDFSDVIVRGHDFDFRPNGNILYVDDRIHESVFQFKLSTSWNVETASLKKVLDISGEQEAVRGIQLGEDGHRMFLNDTGKQKVLEYYLSSTYNIDSASFIGSFSVSSQIPSPEGITFRPDFRMFYVTSTTEEKVYQYKIVVWDPNESSIAASDNKVQANDNNTTTITVTARDEDGDVLPNFDVTLFAEEGNLQVDDPTVETDSNGKARFTVSNNRAETVTYSATASGVELNQTVDVTFIPMDAGLSFLEAGATKILANGEADTRITVFARDENDNPFSNLDIDLIADGGSSTIQTVQGTTDSDGKAIFEVSNDVTEQVQYSARGGGVTIDQTVTVDFVSVDAGESSVSASVDKVQANDKNTGTVTVTARDKDGEVLPNFEVTLFAEKGQLKVQENDLETDSNGEARFKVFNDRAETVTYGARSAGVEIDQKAQITYIPIDAELSFLERGSPKVLANGSAETIITVYARDEGDNPFSNLKMELVPGGGNSNIRKIQEVTDSDGMARFAVSNETAQVVQYSARGGGVTINQSVSVNFVTVDPNQSSASVSPESVQADGEEASTITVVTRDQDGATLAGAVVQLQQNGGSSAISENPITTDENGEAAFTVTNTIPEVVDYRVVAENIELDQQITVNFIPVSPVALTATGVQTRQFVANWELVEGADSYLLDIATDSSFSNIVDGFDAVDVGNATSYTVDGVMPGTTYIYRIRATKDGLIGANSQRIGVTTFPETPVASAPTDRNALKFTANWDAAEGARKYRLDVAKDPNFEHFVNGYQYLVVGDVLSYDIDGLDVGNTYYYRVRSIAGPRMSSYSDVVDASTLAIGQEVSTIESEQIRVLANGDQANIITVTVKSETEIPLEGLKVELTPDNGSSQIEKRQPITDAEGVAIFEVTNTVAEKVAYSVSAEGIDLGEIRVEFLPDAGVLALGNNFPNPFNNQTILPVTVPSPMKISLTIYNSLGSPVQTIIDEEMETGYYEIPFNSSGLASGVYFYRLMTGNKVKTRKMVLVK